MTRIIDLGKIRFNYRGIYNPASTYDLNDVVQSGGDLFIQNTANSVVGVAPVDGAIWKLMLNGAASATTSANVYYVAPHGVDATGYGSSLAKPFASIKYACEQAAQSSTIFVKSGVYSEQLPITVPAGVAIVGDNQRTTIVQPKSGTSDDGVTANVNASMFLMSDGSILNKMTFRGLSGWVPGSSPADITSSTPAGVYVRFNPASPITTKSPYVLECAAFGTGAIGALIDGTVHLSGNKSMVFHGYTIISDLGVGYWAKDGGKAEIVSCFTYYCYFGYATSGGGQIRALNGNNSYGTYGSMSIGYDASETPVTGSLYGKQLNITTPSGNINVGDTVTAVSGGSATVTNVQTSAGKVYVANDTGTFTVGSALTFSSGGTCAVASGGLENQKGFVLVLDNLSQMPVAGGSIQLAGDSSAYVIQTVSGAYAGASSVISLVLANEKATGSASGSAATIRYKYSKTRLTGHDFLSVGTGGVSTTNYPNTPSQAPIQANEILENYPGRVFFVNTDQDGNFRVGKYFKIDQATGKATLNASAFDLSGLSSLRLGSIGAQLGAQIDEFSTDGTLSQNSNTKVSTQAAVRTYVASKVPDPTYASGLFLTNDGVNSYWDGLLVITGESSFQVIAGATIANTTYTAKSALSASPSLTWSLSSDAPSGVSINASTGVFSSTALGIAGTYKFTVNVTDGNTTGRFPVTIYVSSSTSMPVFSGSTSQTVTVPPSSGAFSVTALRATNTSGQGIVHTIISGTIPSGVTFNADGTLTGTAPASATAQKTYRILVEATSNGVTTQKLFLLKWAFDFPRGQALFGTNVGPGTYSWVAPSGVTSVSAVAVGGGGAGADNWSNPCGGGGGLGWKNNITVVPGQTYTVVVGAGGTSGGSGTAALMGGTSYFISTSTVAGYGGANASYTTASGPNSNSYGGGYFGDGGGAGGNASNYQGGGGAGGYTARGGNGYEYNASRGGGGGNGGGYYSSTYGTGAGGGVGLLGQGTTGIYFYTPWTPTSTSPSSGGGGQGGSGGTNGMYGENPNSGQGESSSNIQGGTYGGGGGGPGSSWPSASGNGGQGGVRIIWGPGRSYPTTNTADVTPV